MKLHKETENKEEEFESIAKLLGIDVEKLAQEMLAQESPDGNRQVVRKIIPKAPQADPNMFNMMISTVPDNATFGVKSTLSKGSPPTIVGKGMKPLANAN